MDNLDLTEVMEQESILAQFFTRERVIQLVVSAVVIALAVLFWKLASRAYRRFARGRQNFVPADGKIGTFTSVMLNIIKGAIILVVAIVVLEINGVKVTSLLAGVGIVSAIIGLALQDYLKDVIMGTHIMSDDFFQVGEVIRYGTLDGVVTDFNLRSTKLRSLADGSITTISNRNISEITKLSEQNYLSIPLSYEGDDKKAEEILSRLCEEAIQIDGVTGCSLLGVAELQDSSVLYKVKVLCPPEQKLGICQKVLAHLYAGVKEAGLTIPYSQMDVHLTK